MRDDTEISIRDLADSVRRLAETQERARRRGWLMLAGGLAFGFLLGAGQGAPATAQGLVQRIEDRLARDDQKLQALELKAKEDFEAKMLGLKQRLGAVKEDAGDTGKLVAVILHDMQKALQAMPAMAQDMHEMNAKMSAVPAMAVEMQAMNARMGIMAYGVDSTMGRMGRMVPWMPW